MIVDPAIRQALDVLVEKSDQQDEKFQECNGRHLLDLDHPSSCVCTECGTRFSWDAAAILPRASVIKGDIHLRFHWDKYYLGRKP